MAVARSEFMYYYGFGDDKNFLAEIASDREDHLIHVVYSEEEFLGKPMIAAGVVILLLCAVASI